MLSLISLQNSFAGRFGAIVFVIGKLIRFGMFFLLLAVLFNSTKALAGFTREQIFVVFLTYTLVDSISQLLFREVYRFRGRVVTGDFDLDLIKPLNSLFRPLLGGIDVLDAITLLPYLIVFVQITRGMQIQPLSVALFILLLLNALFISAGFHIIVLSLGVVTSEIDHAILIYRDIFQMGRFPTSIYTGLVRNVLTFVVPLTIMITVPAKVLFGLYSLQTLLAAFATSLIFLLVSLRLWQYALQKYTSASS